MSINVADRELNETPMSERQRSYRETYRSRVSGWYNGWLHVVIIYTIGPTSRANRPSTSTRSASQRSISTAPA